MRLRFVCYEVKNPRGLGTQAQSGDVTCSLSHRWDTRILQTLLFFLTWPEEDPPQLLTYASTGYLWSCI